MNKTMGLLAGIFVAAMLVMPSEKASAVPLSGMAAQAENAAPSLVSDVGYHREYRKHRWTYNYRHHGRRYAYRRHGYNYVYGGFWYAQPWWGVPVYSAPRRARHVSRHDAHVEWCLDKYRSYDPGSDTFLGYDGQRHYCSSPYR